MGVLGRSGRRVVSVLYCFRGWGVENDKLLEKVQLNFSFRNKFIILLPFLLIVDNNTFSKMFQIVQPTVRSRDPLRPASNNEIHMSSFSPIRTPTL